MEENRLRCEVGSEFEIEWPPSHISETDEFTPKIVNPIGKDGVLGGTCLHACILLLVYDSAIYKKWFFS